MEAEQPYQSDEHILCDDCDRLYKGNCTVHGPLEWIKNSRAVESAQYSASIASLPGGLLLKESGIPDVNMGVFAARIIPKRVMFGPFEGRRLLPQQLGPRQDLSHSWDLLQNGLANMVLDGFDETQSNWMRYVTYARDKREQNLIAFQYCGQIFYRTFREIYPGEELMIWFEEEYSCSIDDLPDEFSGDQVPEFACQRCRLVFAGATYLYKHHRFRCPVGPLANTYGARTTGLVGALFRLPVEVPGDTWSNPTTESSSNSVEGSDVDGHHSRRKSKPRKLARQADGDDLSNPEQPLGPPTTVVTNLNGIPIEQDNATLVMLPAEAPALDAAPRFSAPFNVQTDSRSHVGLKRAAQEDTSHLPEKQPRHDIAAEDVKPNEMHEIKHAYACGVCGKTFARPTWWAKHESSHVCKKNLTTMNAAVTTELVHRGNPALTVERNPKTKQPKVSYKCEDCGKLFACPSWLKRHKKVHGYDGMLASGQALVKPNASVSAAQNGRRAHVCGDCGRGFVLAAWLKRHQKVHENNGMLAPGQALAKSNASGSAAENGRRAHVCEDCGRRFAVASWLKRHKKVHENDGILAPGKTLAKPKASGSAAENGRHAHVCGYCGRGFAVAFWLKRHKKVHENDGILAPGQALAKPNASGSAAQNGRRAHVCGDCGRGFAVASWLKRHKKVHENDGMLAPGQGLAKPNASGSTAQNRRRAHVCGDCGRGFVLEAWLKRHKKVHENDGMLAPGQGLAKPNASGSTAQNGRRAHVCGDCGRRFAVASWLKRHKKVHENDGMLTPGQALAKPNASGSAAQNGRRAHVCGDCGRGFVLEAWLKRHKKVHENDGILTPGQALAKPNASGSAAQNGRRAYVCGDCGRGFAVAYWLKRHKKVHEGDGMLAPVEALAKPNASGSAAQNGRRAHVCRDCGRGFILEAWLKRHKKVHENDGMLAPGQALAKPNASGSTAQNGRRAHVCGDCGRGFAVAYWLKRHKKVHEGDGMLAPVEALAKPNASGSAAQNGRRAHVCRDCGRGFAVAAWLTRHKMQHHQKTFSKPHMCGICGRSFAVAYWLARHHRMCHSFENGTATVLEATTLTSTAAKSQANQVNLPWKCRECGLAFRYSSWLRRHQKNNGHNKPKAGTGEPNNDRPFACNREDCGKTFATRRQCGRHRRRHIKNDIANGKVVAQEAVVIAGPPFVCQEQNCRKSFSDRNLYMRHKRQHGKNALANEATLPEMPVKAGQSSYQPETVETSFQCPECGKCYNNEYLLNKHRSGIHSMKILDVMEEVQLPKALEDRGMPEQEHGIDGGPPYNCQQCSKQFSYPLLLNRHLARHKKNEQTRKKLFKALNLTTNALQSGAEHSTFPFVCQVCNSSFKGLHLWNRHMVRHLKSKEVLKEKLPVPVQKRFYQCDECDRSFGASYWLTRHKKEHRALENKPVEPPSPSDPQQAKKNGRSVFICQDCGKEFPWPSWLEKHRRTHRHLQSKDMSTPQPQKQDVKHVPPQAIPDVKHVPPQAIPDVKHVPPQAIPDVKHAPPQAIPVAEPKSRMLKHKGSSRANEVPPKGVKTEDCYEVFGEVGIKQYRCKLCKKTSAWHTGIVYHVRVHHTHERPFQCQVCLKAFHMAGDLTKHARRHSGEKPFPCKGCSKSFATSQQARRHGAVHTAALPYYCIHCGKRYRDRSSVWRHKLSGPCSKSAIERKLTRIAQAKKLAPVKSKTSAVLLSEASCFCSICNKHFEDNGSLWGHRLRVHPNLLLGTCKRCGNKKEEGHNCKGKAADKRLTYTCLRCNKSFNDRDTYRNHMVTHRTGGRIICVYCGKSWLRKADLTRHLRVHTGERPYPCPDCGLAFKVSDGLRRHMRSLHPTSTKQYIKLESKPMTWPVEQTTKLDQALDKPEQAAAVVSENAPKESKPLDAPRQEEHHVSNENETETSEAPSNISSRRNSDTSKKHAEEKPEKERFRVRIKGKANKPKVKITWNSAEVAIKKEKVEMEETPSFLSKKSPNGRRLAERKCKYCGKLFSLPGNLARHVRLHTGEKPFSCAKCGETFMRSDVLSQHMSTFH